MTVHPRKPGRVRPALDLRETLPRCDVALRDLPAVATALARLGRLSATCGDRPLTLQPAPAGEDPVAPWWKLAAGRHSVLFAVSGDVVGDAGHVPAFFALELALDPILSALEDHLGFDVDVEAVEEPWPLPHRRAFDFTWGEAKGRLTLAFETAALPLVGSVLGALPFAAPERRDAQVTPMVRLGRFAENADRLLRMQPGEILLPTADQLRCEGGILVVAGRDVAAVTLDGQGARIAPPDNGDGEVPAADQSGPGGVDFCLPCVAGPRGVLRALPAGTLLETETADPTRVLIVQATRIIGDGTLIRLGARLAVELRGWRPGFAHAVGHPARSGQKKSEDAHLVRMLKDRSVTLCP